MRMRQGSGAESVIYFAFTHDLYSNTLYGAIFACNSYYCLRVIFQRPLVFPLTLTIPHSTTTFAMKAEAIVSNNSLILHQQQWAIHEEMH